VVEFADVARVLEMVEDFCRIRHLFSLCRCAPNR
jgi:hypothetical protein